ncbi:MAG: hypothetical protein AABO57_19140 [Acidobacteriota bacterium]
MRVITTALSILIFAALLGTAVKGYREHSFASTSEGAQDTAYLDRRITMLENKLNTVESSLRRLESQAMSPERSAPSQPGRDPETSVLRSEVELLKMRVRDLECGLLHLDERTLSASAKEARKRTGLQPMEHCRLNPEAPVQLFTQR